MARPTDYTEELADKICEEILNNTYGLHTICDREGMPDVSTVFRWINKYPEFCDKYARAREIQAELLADEIIKISNTPVEGTKTKTTERGTEVTTGDMIEHRRLQIDARKWKASKLYPKRFGEKVDVTTNGQNIAASTVKAILPDGTELEI